MRAFRSLAPVCLALSMLVSADVVRGITVESLKDTPIATTAVTRENLDLRLSVSADRLVDRLTFTPGKKVVSNSTANPVVRGWSCEPFGKSYVCNGPAARRVYVGLTLVDGIRVPDTVDLELGYGGEVFSRQELPVQQLDRIEVLRGPQGVLSAPPGVRAGEVFIVTPTYDIPGEWKLHVGGRPIEPIDPTTLGQAFDLDSGNALFFRMPETATDGDELSFTFDGPFGRRWVDAPAPDYLWGGGAEDCGPRLEVCQERAVVNGTLCLCGCFPGTTWSSLTLDGKPIPMPRTTSSRAIRIPLPEGIEPGRHTIAWSETGQSMEFEAVQVRGSIDRDKLKSGQSANLKFWLEGTEDPLPLAVDLTRGSVSIVGGNHQTAYTTGGADNSLRRVMFAGAPGDFGIRYTFAAAPCPCPGEPEESLFDDDFAVHPASAAGRLNLDFTSGGKGSYPLTVETDSLVLSTDFPPFTAGQDLEVEFRQLGLRGSTPGYGEFVFEERADLRSFGRFSGIEIGGDGGFGAGKVDLELHADWTTPFDKKLPFKVGKSYDLRMSDFELRGSFPGIGDWTFTERQDTESTLRLENIRKDAAGTTLRGDATFRMYGLSKLQVKF